MVEPFRNIQFPEYISYQSRSGDGWATQIVRTNSGHELRNQVYANPLRQFDVSIDRSRDKDMDEVREFFNAVRGQAYSFRFRDWNDYRERHDGLDEPAPFANWTGAGTYQLVKNYTFGAYSYVRTIKLPRVQGSGDEPGVSWDTHHPAQDFELWVDDTQLAYGSDFTVNTTTGEITVTYSGSGTLLKARYEYDVPARFATDTMDTTKLDSQLQSWVSIKIAEVRY